ncbi:MAG TPA: hypothetical protein O0X23_03915 [Methanocorpusculum sp.]|nr:hypothetical protein [Methanocorpusculum sp.]
MNEEEGKQVGEWISRVLHHIDEIGRTCAISSTQRIWGKGM